MPVKSAQTRRRVLDAAARILAANGFAGTRLSDIADEAELQAPAIYYYFGSREDLIEEVMWVGNVGTRKYVLRTLDALDASTSPLDRILVAVKAHLEHILSISDYAKAATRNGRQLPERMQARQLAEQAEYSHIWRSLLADAAAAGQLREDLDLFAARMLILGALNWAPEWWDVNRGSLESLIHTAQDMVCHGISATVTGPRQPAPAPVGGRPDSQSSDGGRR
jgi:AcrR family transcriptional regulator